jgi:glycine cleavage system H protein
MKIFAKYPSEAFWSLIMKCSVDNTHSHQIVPEKQRCIWMTAGILMYQICDREFDCDKCPLDQAMRMHLVHKDVSLNKTSPASSMIVHKSEEYRYSNEHCWLEQVESNVVKVGIEPTLASSLISVKAVVFPSVGQEINRHDPICWIIVDEGTLQLHSPVDGEIYAVNVNLLDNPQKICDNSISPVWLLKIKTLHGAFLSPLLRSKRDIQRNYDEDLATFNKLLSETLKGSGSVGMTLQDGGLPFRAIPSGMSRTKYYEILKQAFRL